MVRHLKNAFVDPTIRQWIIKRDKARWSFYDKKERGRYGVEALTTSIEHWQSFQSQYSRLSIYLAIFVPAVDDLESWYQFSGGF